jgi:glycosyltransferase involved in cell wall biosynthesis
MGRKIRVAQIITGLVLGGGGQVMWTIARNIDKSRFDLDVYCISSGGELVEEIERLDCRIQIFPAYDHRRIGRYRPGPILDLARALRQGRYDVVHTHLFQADIVGKLASRLAGLPHVVRSLHNMGAWKRRPHILIDRWLARKEERVVCCSEHLRTSAIRQEGLDPGRVLTIHHGVDAARFAVSVDRDRFLRSLGLSPELRVVGTIGRPIAEKGHKFLLQAIPAILEQHPNTQFLIVGEGRLRRAFERQVAREPFGGRVHFVGARADVPELLSVMDVFAFPSVSEGLGIALLEAMAARVPIVASGIPPLTEIAEDGATALLVPPRDPRALAAAVVRLLGNAGESARLRDRAYAHVTSRFTERQMVARLEHVYRQLTEATTRDRLLEGASVV